jgi:hypothetical protein
LNFKNLGYLVEMLLADVDFEMSEGEFVEGHGEVYT